MDQEAVLLQVQKQLWKLEKRDKQRKKELASLRSQMKRGSTAFDGDNLVRWDYVLYVDKKFIKEL